jgi:hypothetical protein
MSGSVKRNTNVPRILISNKKIRIQKKRRRKKNNVVSRN